MVNDSDRAGDVVPERPSRLIDGWVARSAHDLPVGYPERIELLDEGGGTVSVNVWFLGATHPSSELFWSLAPARADARELLNGRVGLYVRLSIFS